jgi:simple sugar transport system substrate-binding protein
MHRKIPRLGGVVIGAVSVVALAACSTSTSTSGTSTSTSNANASASNASTSTLNVIAVEEGPDTQTHWIQEDKGFTIAAHQAGVNFTYLGTTGSGSTDPEQFVQLLHTAMARHPSAMIIDDDTPGSYDPIIKSITKSGTPVIFTEFTQSSVVPDGALGLVGTSDESAGFSGGKTLVADGCKRVLDVGIIKGQASFSDNVTNGLTEAFSAAGGTVVRTQIPLSDIQDSTFIKNIVQADLTKDPSIGCTFADGELFTPAMVSAQQALSGRHLSSGGVDVSPQIDSEIASHQLTFAIDDQPFLTGYLALLSIVAYLRYGEVPSQTIGTGPAVVTSSNVAYYEKLAGDGYH